MIHTLEYRVQNKGTVSYTHISQLELETDIPQDRLINEANNLAKRLGYQTGTKTTSGKDGVAYRIDGELVHYIGKHFYVWPNYTD